MHAKLSKPPSMFQCNAVDISPNFGGGVKMSSKLSKWLSDICNRRTTTHGIRESFLTLDLFSLTFKNNFWALLSPYQWRI